MPTMTGAQFAAGAPHFVVTTSTTWCGCVRAFAWDRRVPAESRVEYALIEPAQNACCDYHAKACINTDGVLDVELHNQLIDDENARIKDLQSAASDALAPILKDDPDSISVPFTVDPETHDIAVQYDSFPLTPDQLDQVVQAVDSTVQAVSPSSGPISVESGPV